MSKSKSTQNNQVAWSAPPPTTATTNLQNQVDAGGADYSTPIRNAYARAEQQNARTYNNPLGAYTTADVRDKSQREQNAQLGQSEGLDLSNAAQQTAQNQFNNQATVANLTAPRLYNSQSVNTQPVTPWDVLGLGTSTLTGALS